MQHHILITNLFLLLGSVRKFVAEPPPFEYSVVCARIQPAKIERSEEGAGGGRKKEGEGGGSGRDFNKNFARSSQRDERDEQQKGRRAEAGKIPLEARELEENSPLSPSPPLPPTRPHLGGG